MRILYCIHGLYSVGGTERVITEKANFLAQLNDFDVTIVTTEQKQSQEIVFQINPRIDVIHLELNFNDHFNNNLISKYIKHKSKLKEYEKRLTEIIRNKKIDICISTCGKEIEFLTNIKVNCAKIAEIHYSMKNREQFIAMRTNNFLMRYWGKYRTQQLIKSVQKLDKLIVLTKEDYKQWKNVCDNIIVINNPSTFSSETTSELKNKVAISIGRLDPQKGYDMLIRIWELVALNHPDWELHIYGDGDLKDELQESIDRKKLQNTIKLLGVTNNIKKKYLSASLYLMSSRYEGLPMVLLEAISFGLPIVSFDCEFGPREVIANGQNGYLIEPYDKELFAEKVCEIIENIELRRALGAKSFEMSTNFSIQIIMKKWIDLFNSLQAKQI